MSFDAPKLMLVGLAEMALPTKTVRLCDGGYIYWGADRYSSADDEFGAIASVDVIDERLGDEAPGGRLTFLPQSTADAAVLSQPSFQGSPLRFWLARVSEQTGQIDGTPELIFDGELDTTTLRVGRSTRFLDMEFISVAERLFNVNEGNVLSSRFHQSIWPGEQGLDNAGTSITVAWGTEAPPRAGSTGYYGSGAGGGGFLGMNLRAQ